LFKDPGTKEHSVLHSKNTQQRHFFLLFALDEYISMTEFVPETRFLLDVRPRKPIVETLYVEHLHTSVRFLVAQPEDEEVLLDYICDVVHKTEPDNIASGKVVYSILILLFQESAQKTSENGMRKRSRNGLDVRLRFW
jgi:hypothetical protein